MAGTIKHRDSFGNPVYDDLVLNDGTKIYNAAISSISYVFSDVGKAASFMGAFASLWHNYGLAEDPYEEWTGDDEADLDLISSCWLNSLSRMVSGLWGRYSKIVEAYETKIDWLSGITNETTYDVHDKGTGKSEGTASSEKSGTDTYDVTDSTESSEITKADGSATKTDTFDTKDKLTNDDLKDETTLTGSLTQYDLPNKSVSTPYGTPTSHTDRSDVTSNVKSGGTTTAKTGTITTEQSDSMDSSVTGSSTSKKGGSVTNSATESGKSGSSSESTNDKTGSVTTKGMLNPVSQRDLYVTLLRDAWIEMARECSPLLNQMHM